MGSFGPVRVTTASPEATGPAPYTYGPNDESLLDKTDLVFIDAIGTGYSRPLGDTKGETFWGGRRGRRRLRPRHHPLRLAQRPVEQPQVPVRRKLRHHALGRPGQCAARPGHGFQRRHPAVVDPQLRHRAAGLRHRIYRLSAVLRRHRLVSRQAGQQAGRSSRLRRRGARLRRRSPMPPPSPRAIISATTKSRPSPRR
ncbi:MAG: hypothetical protein WDN06_08775 [Asticcacaulis sp.]